MPEITDVNTKAADTGAQGAYSAPQSAAPVPDAPANLDHTKIRGRFNQYQSSYWVLALPLLGVRYLAEGFNEIFEPLKVVTDLKQRMSKWTRPEKIRQVTEEIRKEGSKSHGHDWKEGMWVYPVATIMLAVTGFYTSRTYGDMKREFKEPLAWEFGKDPEKIGLLDMVKSKNTLVHDAIRNFEWRTASRFLAYAPFLTFLVKSPFKNPEGGFVVEIGEVEAKDKKLPGVPREYMILTKKVYSKLISPKGATNLAVGTASAYLASDALLRKRTFFEELQALVDNKINHTDRIGDSVTAADLMNLYDRQARKNPGVKPLPKMGSQQWADDNKLFERMADLMNQTYSNTPNREQANFTVPKLIYMLGMRLLKTDDAAKNMAYLEVANRYGIKAVEQVARDSKGEGSLAAALAPYPNIAAKVLGKEPALPITQADNSMLASMGIAPEPVTTQAEKSFANEGLKRSRPEAPPASQVDKIAQNSEVGVGISIH